MKLLSKCIIIIFVLFNVASISVVSASWLYSFGNVQSQEKVMELEMNVFDYAPEEVLPGDDNTSIGENHLTLLEIIANHASYGLNATHKPIIHNYMTAPGALLYCDQNVKGGNLKHLMIDNISSSNRLYFIVEMVSETVYNVYTMRMYDIDYNAVGVEIEVYKSLMVRNEKGVWAPTYSYQGYARINDPSVVSRAVDVTTWREK